MGLILPQKIQIKWATTSRQHYIDLGYQYTKVGDIFEVDIEHLSNGSTNKVKIKCDYCETTKNIAWKDYMKLQGDTYCCPNCLKHKKKTRDENGKLIFIEVPYRNKEWLENEYLVKSRKASDIAKECGINIRTLREWISNFELNNKYDLLKEILTKDILEELYVIKHMTSEEIGNKYGTTGNTVISLVREYGLKVPTRSELLEIYYNKKGGYEKVRATQSKLENRIKSSCRQHGISIDEFKGFSTTEQHMSRNNTYYKEWVRKVFKRDNYTCQCCGKHGGDLNAHRLYNFSEYEDLRYDVDNGITFCKECHLINYPFSFHSLYGERNNTPEQVKDFIHNHQKEAI